ncbi:MAG: hypothetical protein GKC05_06625 [Methanomicrobiales archaeon]|nr:hypothetical protein [Methanomicrobiales archaeon]NYT21427.1 hypothetical protein [Methanomicrobiales archaeon]
MSSDQEYVHILEHLYEKSLILHDESMWHPVLAFYFMDALAHIDYTVGLMAYHYKSPRVMMTGEYLRCRVDQEKLGDRPKFPAFITWLKKEHPEKYAGLPTLWRRIYDEEDEARYISFRIVFDRTSREPVLPHIYRSLIEELFDAEFLKSLYNDASLAMLFEEFRVKA